MFKIFKCEDGEQDERQCLLLARQGGAVCWLKLCCANVYTLRERGRGDLNFAKLVNQEKKFDSKYTWWGLMLLRKQFFDVFIKGLQNVSALSPITNPEIKRTEIKYQE